MQSAVLTTLMGTKELGLILQEAFSYPHRCMYLSYIFAEFDGMYRKNHLYVFNYIIVVSPPTKDFVKSREKFLKLSNKIVAAEKENKNREWFQMICDTKDDRYIIQNTECRIAREPFNIEIWKLYIQFLLTKNGKVRCERIWNV